MCVDSWRRAQMNQAWKNADHSTRPQWERRVVQRSRDLRSRHSTDGTRVSHASARAMAFGGPRSVSMSARTECERGISYVEVSFATYPLWARILWVGQRRDGCGIASHTARLRSVATRHCESTLGRACIDINHFSLRRGDGRSWRDDGGASARELYNARISHV